MTKVEAVFNRHYQYYQGLGIETIKQQAGQVEQVSSDYQGRVIFELLQNAFDRADKNILVEVKGQSLYIANDGKKFTYNANHDYETGGATEDKFVRYDFQSLCSISTSSKTTSESIGNKGVGFKSVFSIARDGFVNVYTNGLMYKDGEPKEELISFGIYDSFKDIKNLPFNSDSAIRSSLLKQIKHLQLERKERGVPGYYYPIHIKEESQIIQDYFNSGFVTIIEIPFEDIDKLKPYFEEIKRIHFNFVHLKYPKAFEINFQLNGESFPKQIDVKTGLFFTTSIKNEILEPLAIDAGVVIGNENKVAINFKSDEDVKKEEKAWFYNYLPTKEASPFKYVDFHADFHTSVDRKTIDFDENSKIGKYNLALLNACVELFVATLYSYGEGYDEDLLDIKYLTKVVGLAKLEKFQWQYLEFANTDHVFHILRRILKIWNYGQHNYSYLTASNFLTDIAKEYFSFERDLKRYEQFFEITMSFIIRFSRKSGQGMDWPIRFKEKFAELLIEKNIQVIPNVRIEKGKEVLFRENSDNSIELPGFLGIDITSFNIGDKTIKRVLDIKDYSDINVLFRHFRQVNISGAYNEECISEEKQIILLRSLAQLFIAKTDQIESFVHRYQSLLAEKESSFSSVQNITAFSVSTVFLKTKNNLFKPAQICDKEELDMAFIDGFTEGFDIDLPSFLSFLGVSLVPNYLVVDELIYNKFINGVDLPPQPLLKDERESIVAKAIIPNIKLITPKNKIHPALINYNRYPFLYDISPSLKKYLFPLRIGEYDQFSKEYATILLKVMKENTPKYAKDVFRLYSANTFHLFHRLGEYLVVRNGDFNWSQKPDFIIAKGRNDFETLMNQNQNVLCFFNGNKVPESLQQYLVDIKTKDINLNNKKEITNDFKIELEKLIPYILAEISYLNTSVSEKDYIKNLNEIESFQDNWRNKKFITGDKLTVILTHNKDNKDTLEIKQNYSFFENTIYFDNNISESQKAEAIAKNVFNIGSLSAKIELLLFHKKIEDLDAEYNQSDLELIKSRWLPDYTEKYEWFQKEILEYFGFSQIYELWYKYSSSNPSNILKEIDRKGQLNELFQLVNNLKEKTEFTGYFDSFKIEIDLSYQLNKAAQLLFFLEEKVPVSELIEEIKALSKKLGNEGILDKIESEIILNYPTYLSECSKGKVDKAEKRNKLNNRVDDILGKFPLLKKKGVNHDDLTGNHSKKQLLIKEKKIIFKGTELPSEKNLESIGALGEEEVLLFFIAEFLQINEATKRENAIHQVYKLLEKTIGDKSHEQYRDACLKVVNDNDKLRKALIPFFYVTMHHKYSYFDLIAFNEDKPVIVEVKTSAKGRRFYLSIEEVETARREENYLIVFNTSDSINILGNPIKSVEDAIQYVDADKFVLKPRNYIFEIKK